MKTIVAAFFFLAFLISGPDTFPNGQSSLRIKFESKKKTGRMFIAVYDKKEDFLGSHMTAKKITDCNSSGSTLVEIELQHGIYGISVFQDLNENGELDKNWFGIPTEPYGFSNNAKGSFGPPDFEDCSFEFSEDMEINIKLN